MGRFESLKVTSSIKKTETISLFNVVSCREKWKDLSVRMATQIYEISLPGLKNSEIFFNTRREILYLQAAM